MCLLSKLGVLAPVCGVGGIVLQHNETASISASKRGDQWKYEKGRVTASGVNLVKPGALGMAGPEEDVES
jgi:hypothetical protein